MVGEANAAIEGALAAGATDVLVNDSHWNMYNLLPVGARPGGPRPPGREGLVDGRRRQPAADGSPVFDVALFVGYHARAGHPTGTIAHTYSGAPGRDPPRRPPDRRVRLQRARARRVGHPGRHGHGRRRARRGGRRVAAVGRAGGRQGRRRRAQRDLGPPVGRLRPGPRRGRAGRPAGGRRRAQAAARRPAGRRSRSTTRRASMADFAAIVPGAERFGDPGVRYTSDDPVTAFRGFLAGQPAGRHRRLSGGPYSARDHQLPGARDRASRPPGGARDPATPASPPARPRRPHRARCRPARRTRSSTSPTSASGTRRSGATSRRRRTAAAWPAPA